MPIERFKDAYENWRYNPFTAADMAVDKEEDSLTIPSGSPFVVQLLEVPRKNTPTTITVYCYDDVAYFTEVVTAPSQGEFRVDYPPDDGEGTGLVEFNQNDASKEIRVNYKATGSPMLGEFLDTKVSYPAGNPTDHQILGFISGAPEWRYNPIRYFHEGSVIYHAGSEDYSCLLFRFKKSSKEATAILELKGAVLHQGYYTELKEHNHGCGSIAVASGGAHTHANGTLAGSQPGHTHGIGTLAGSQPGHTHGIGTLTVVSYGAHVHANGTLGISGSTGNQDASHNHAITGRMHSHAGVAVNGGYTGGENGCDSPTGNQSANHKHPVGTLAISGSMASTGNHNHALSGSTASDGDDAVPITGNMASAGNDAVTIYGVTASGGAHSHGLSGNTASAGVAVKSYPNQLKVYINGVDKTVDILALTGLTQFGNGTGVHAFVTTGSGEMDISSLVAANQFHEIKITEPISGMGGRCLLHLELY